MATAKNIQLYKELLKEAEEKVAIDPGTLKMLLAGLGGGAAVGVPAHLLTRLHGDREREATRNRSFGAGVATGFAAPQIIRGLFDIARQGEAPSQMPMQMPMGEMA